jgi:hypothetical protein
MSDEIRNTTAGSGNAMIHLPVVYPDEKATFTVPPNISSDVKIRKK